MKLAELALDKIEFGNRARTEYKDMDQLVESIVEQGLITPIAVVEQGGDIPYLLLAGGRRLRACETLEWEFIPCRIYEESEGLEPNDHRAIELAENVVRSDLNWQEKLELIASLDAHQKEKYGEKKTSSKHEKGWNTSMTATLVGKDASGISKDLSLHKLMQSVPELASCKTKDEAIKLAKKAGETVERNVKVNAVKAKAANTPTEKIKKNICDGYIVSDFVKGVSRLDDNLIDFVELDPPYAVNLTQQKKLKGGSKNSSVSDYNEIDAKEYAKVMTAWLSECYRVLKPNGWIVVWFAPDPWFETISGLMKGVGFKMRTHPLIWAKPAGQTQRPDTYLGSNYEMAFYACKGDGAINKQGRGNIYNYKPVNPENKIHPTERPIEMVQDLVETFCPIDVHSKVLVPCAGSGNTLLACANLGIMGIGYDISEPYHDLFVERVHDYELGEYASYVKGEK